MQHRLPIYHVSVSPLANRKRLFNRSTLKGKGLIQFYRSIVELAKSLLGIYVKGLKFNAAKKVVLEKAFISVANKCVNADF